MLQLSRSSVHQIFFLVVNQKKVLESLIAEIFWLSSDHNVFFGFTTRRSEGQLLRLSCNIFILTFLFSTKKFRMLFRVKKNKHGKRKSICEIIFTNFYFFLWQLFFICSLDEEASNKIDFTLPKQVRENSQDFYKTMTISVYSSEEVNLKKMKN